MPLMLNSGGGDYLGFVRYMASTSSWEMSAEGGKQPFTFSKAAFDFSNIETGWCAFEEGQGPQWVMDESLTKPAARPEGDAQWKRGFKIKLYSKDMFGDEPVREWATNSAGGTMAIQAVYAEWEKQADDSKVAVVQFNGATPTKVGRGSTTVPQFEIIKLVDRPAELAAGSTPPLPAATSVNDDEDEFAI